MKSDGIRGGTPTIGTQDLRSRESHLEKKRETEKNIVKSDQPAHHVTISSGKGNQISKQEIYTYNKFGQGLSKNKDILTTPEILLNSSLSKEGEKEIPPHETEPPKIEDPEKDTPDSV